jgi:endonuclease YncB( thermonuclease family)
MKILSTILIVILMASPCFSAERIKKGSHITGEVSYVFDGDTISLGEKRIRLEGIDCPENMQLCKDATGSPYKCGDTSTEFLKELIKDKEVYCAYQGKDVYKRYLGICYAGELNINAEMVRSGHAIAREYEGESFYKPEELEAKNNKAGLWQGDFTTPHRWRMKFGKSPTFKF